MVSEGNERLIGIVHPIDGIFDVVCVGLERYQESHLLFEGFCVDVVFGWRSGFWICF